MARNANYSIVRMDARAVVIRDNGPWHRYSTVTNDAERVVRELRATLNGRRLFYYDSTGQLDEITTRMVDGVGQSFAGFAHCGDETVGTGQDDDAAGVK